MKNQPTSPTPDVISNERPSWIMLPKQTFVVLGEIGQQNPVALTLFHYVLARMDSKGYLISRQQKLISELKVTASMLKEALATLEERNFIQVLESDDGNAIYMVNPGVAFRGTESTEYSMFQATVKVS